MENHLYGIDVADLCAVYNPLHAKHVAENAAHVAPGDDVYEGMIVGMNARNDDMVVNPCKAKRVSNMRAAGSDDTIKLTPPRVFSLEEALEFINDDELVEVTPDDIRLRKKYLNELERRRANR